MVIECFNTLEKLEFGQSSKRPNRRGVPSVVFIRSFLGQLNMDQTDFLELHLIDLEKFHENNQIRNNLNIIFFFYN